MNPSKRDETHRKHKLKQSLKQHEKTKTHRQKQSPSVMMNTIARANFITHTQPTVDNAEVVVSVHAARTTTSEQTGSALLRILSES